MVAVKVLVVFAISVQPPPLSYCHFVTFPVFPDKVRIVEFVPEHTVALPAMVPPADIGFTVTVAVAEFVAEQTPLVITALYEVVTDKLVAVKVLVVFAISVQPPPLSYCHFVTVPVFPDKVRIVELVPEHTVALPAMVPPTDIGFTVTVAVAEFTAEQTPLVITAL